MILLSIVIFGLMVERAAAAAVDQKLPLGRFGSVSVYGQDNLKPQRFVIFLSGDAGWNAGMASMVKPLLDRGAVVVGVSTPEYLKQLRGIKEKCHYPAADFEALSHLLQKQWHFPRYIRPTLLGYSSGATLAYATLVQAPPQTFAGAVSMGFCPDLGIDRPFCKGHGLTAEPWKKKKGFDLLPTATLEQPWYILNGTQDQVCPIAPQRAFAAKTPRSILLELPKVGHGFSVPKNWAPSLNEALEKISAQDNTEAKSKASTTPDIDDLPLIELPHDPQAQKDVLFIIWSGDGGWSSLDKELAEQLNLRGYSVVGLDSLRYFWEERTPDQIGKDMNRIAQAFLKSWGLKRIVWIGYSMGADILPFGLSRMTHELAKKTLGAAYLGLGKKADFEFRVANWLVNTSTEDGHPIDSELKRLPLLKQLCLRGEDEDESGCDGKHSASFTSITVAGGHHFGGDYDKLADLILKYFSLL